MKDFRICVSTSNLYHHILPTFFMLYGRTIGRPMELVGYDKPKMDLPDYVTWISLGEQRGPKYYSDDMAKYFSAQPEYFMYLMEDCLIKSFDGPRFDEVCKSIESTAHIRLFQKFNLTNEAMRRPHRLNGPNIFHVDDNAQYRLSMQPAIWERDFFVRNLPPGLDPWMAEKQHGTDGLIAGAINSIIHCNEGVRKNDIYNLNLDGIEI